MDFREHPVWKQFEGFQGSLLRCVQPGVGEEASSVAALGPPLARCSAYLAHALSQPETGRRNAAVVEALNEFDRMAGMASAITQSDKPEATLEMCLGDEIRTMREALESLVHSETDWAQNAAEALSALPQTENQPEAQDPVMAGGSGSLQAAAEEDDTPIVSPEEEQEMLEAQPEPCVYWFFNRYYHPDSSATSALLSDLTFALAEEGVHVRVVTGRQFYTDPKATPESHEAIFGVTVDRLWSTRFGRDRVLGRSLDLITLLFGILWFGIRYVKREHVVVAKSDPPMLGFVLATAALIRRNRLVMWTQDVYPEVAFVRAKRSLAFHLLRKMRNWSMRRCFQVVVPSDSMAEFLKSEASGNNVANHGLPAFSVIRNWSRGDELRPLEPDQNPLRKEWGLEGCFVVGYCGNLGRVHSTHTFASAMRYLTSPQKLDETIAVPPEGDRRRVSDVWKLHNRTRDEAATVQVRIEELRFLLVGGGHEMERLQRELSYLPPERFVFRDYQPRNLLDQVLSVPDVHLISLDPAYSNWVHPSKLSGILAVGRPVVYVGSTEDEMARLIEKYEIGFSVSDGDGTELSRCVVALHGDPDLRARLSGNALKLFEDEYEFQTLLNKWREVLALA